MALPLRGDLHLGKLTGALLFGVVGTAILLSLGFWQVQRLAWKQGVIAQIETRLSEEVAGIPATPTEAEDEYLGVRVEGTIEPGEVHVLGSHGGIAFRVIAPLVLADERRILLDRGFVSEGMKDEVRPIGPVLVEGNLLWPDETDSFTPDPNLDRNIWFARDVEPMAAALGTEPVLVVARDMSLGGTSLQPVTVDMPNRHLEYAITWFSMAAAWSMMTVYMLWRIKRRID